MKSSRTSVASEVRTPGFRLRLCFFWRARSEVRSSSKDKCSGGHKSLELSPRLEPCQSDAKGSYDFDIVQRTRSLPESKLIAKKRPSSKVSGTCAIPYKYAIVTTMVDCREPSTKLQVCPNKLISINDKDNCDYNTFWLYDCGYMI